jgi:hypothetical protein
MVTVLRKPERPDSQFLVHTLGVIYEEPYCAFREG